MPYKRIPFKVYPAVPNWAHIYYCRRSRAASIIQHRFRLYRHAKRQRAANIILKFMLRYTDAWRML